MSAISPESFQHETSEIEGAHDLSPIQQAMLVEERLAGHDGLYSLCSVVTLRGELDPDRLRAAVRHTAKRHGALRTTFVWDGLPQPIQIVWTSADIPLRVLDWSDVAHGEIERRWQQLLEQERREGFDLERGPLLRATLVQLGGDEARLLVSSHHLIVDGWSLMLVLEEIFDLYRGADDELMPHPPQYGDYIGWLRAQPNEDAFWRGWLREDGSNARSLGLPHAGSSAGRSGGETSVRLTEVATRRMVERATELGATPASLLHAAWALTLWRYAGSDHVTFGTVVSGRLGAETVTRHAVGPLIHTLPLRVAVSAEQTLRGFLGQVYGRTNALVDKVAPLYEIAVLAGVPSTDLFETVIVVENLPTADVLRSASVREIEIVGFSHYEQPKFPVELIVFPGPRVELILRYRGDRVTDALAVSVLRNYVAALEAILSADGDARLGELHLLADEEQRDLLERPPKREEMIPEADVRVCELLRARDLELPALVEGTRSLTHRELWERVHRVAGHMRARGITVEDRVLVRCGATLDSVVSLLATWEVGASFGWVDPDVSDELLDRVLEAADVRLVVVGEPADARPADARPAGACAALAELLDTEPSTPVAAYPPSPQNAALFHPVLDAALRVSVVEWSHGWVKALATWAGREHALESGEVCLSVVTGTDLPLLAVMGALASGATLHFVGEDTVRDVEALRSRSSELGATKVFAPVAGALGSARDDTLAGPDGFVSAWASHPAPPAGPLGVQWAEGVAETGGSDIVYRSPTEGGLPLAEPLPDQRCYVLDCQLRPVPGGVRGRLVVGGVGLARGYAGFAASTAERFIPDPYSSEPGARLFVGARSARWMPPRGLASEATDPKPEARWRPLSTQRWLARGSLESLRARIGVPISVEDLARIGGLQDVARRVAGPRSRFRPAGPDEADARLTYWRAQLSGAPGALELPLDRPRPRVRSPRPERLAMAIPPERMAVAEALARELRATPFMVALSVFDLLLSRYARTNDVVVGVPVPRARATSAQHPDDSNALVLRTDLSGDPTFEELVERVKEVSLCALAQGAVSLTELSRELAAPRDPSVSALFQVMFAFGAPSAGLAGGPGPAELDLVMELQPSGHGAVVYDASLFEEDTIRGLAEQYGSLLRACSRAPGVAVSTLRLGPDEGLSKVRGESSWGALPTGQWPPPRPEVSRAHLVDRSPTQLGREPLHVRFYATAARCPDATAVRVAGRAITYRELALRARAVAHLLAQRGIGPGDRIGICVPRSLELVVALFGVLEAGAAYVSLSPSWPDDRLAFIGADARLRAVLAFGADAARLAPLGVDVVEIDRLPTHAPDGWQAPWTSVDALAYVLYTSGSTGRPKGVAVPHRAVDGYCRWAAHAYPTGGRSVVHTSFSFDATVTSLLAPLLEGGTVELLPDGGELDSLTEALRSTEPLLVKATPSHLAGLSQLLQGSPPLRAAHTFVVGGEALSPPTVERLLELSPSSRVVNEYGPTETVVGCCVHAATRGSELGSTVPIGLPTANTELAALDEWSRPLPAGVPGELHIGGGSVTWGYLGRPGLTAERFLPDCFGEPGARMYRSGDWVRLRRGSFEYLGRSDQQVKVRGFRVELGEVETHLESLPGVSQAAARVWGAGAETRLAGYVVGRPGAALETSALRERLAERLPEYMVPDALVVLRALPLTSNGKVDRGSLPPPAGTGAVRHEAPATSTERLIASIWSEVLGVSRVGRQDDFFRLGGHSLLATKVVWSLRARRRVELSLEMVFEHPKLFDLARAVDALEGGSALPPVTATDRAGPLPLSFAQERLCFLDRLLPESAAYNMPASLRLHGDLDEAALGEAITTLVARHEALRTRFVEHDGVAAQVIEAEVASPFATQDLRGLDDPAGEARRLADELMRRPFDLSRAPLLRVRLLRLADREHLLVFVMHHVVSDGWSLGVVVREIQELYDARVQGRGARLPDLPVQYPDYSAWQRTWLSGDELERQLGFWRQELEGAPPVLTLPTDRPRPKVKGDRGGAVPVVLAAETSRLLEEVSSALRVTPFMTLLAAWQLLLGKYARVEDLVVGVPVAGRRLAELEGLIGFFVNTLPLRGDLSGDPTFEELVQRARERSLGAFAHQDLPFEKLVAELEVPRNTAITPIFQAMLVWEDAPGRAPQLAGLEVEREPFESRHTKVDLSLAIGLDDDGVTGALTFDSDLFERSTAERIARHFGTLLHRALRCPTRRASELSLLEDAERQELVERWNDTALELDLSVRVEGLFEAHAAARPDDVAVVHEDARLTYAELDERANRLAGHLVHRLGVAPEDRVGIWIDRSVEMIECLLAVLKTGAAYVALDPEHPIDRARLQLEDASAVAVIGSERLVAGLRGDEGPVVCSIERDRESWAQRRAERPTVPASAEGLLYVTYTSGSTGRPKGVAVEHRQMLNYVFGLAERLSLRPEWSHATVSTLAADLGNTAIFSALCRGGTLHVVSSERVKDASSLESYLSEHRVDCLKAVPPHMQTLLASSRGTGVLPARRLILGGEAFTWELGEELRRRGGPAVFNHYGPSEATVGVASNALEGASERGASVPIGHPLPNSRLYVVDGRLEPTPLGAPGELLIGGAGLTRGYLGRPGQTAERFLPDPFGAPGSRLYRTGDQVRRLEDGSVEFLGRIDFQVKIRGHRVELGEVEARLRALPGVAQAVALVRTDPKRGPHLVAYVVPTAGTELVASRLASQVGEKLPSYMVPAAWVVLEALPLTSNKKVDRRALPEPRWEAAEFEPPSTRCEVVIAELWAELLGVERAGRQDDFFALGGHSLLATRLVSRIRQRLDVELGVREVFEHPRLSELAARAELQGATPLAPLTRAPRGDALRVSFAQERMWVLQQLRPDSLELTRSIVYRLEGPVDLDALAAAIEAVVTRHEVLRTVFRNTPDGVRAHVLPIADIGSVVEVEAGARDDSDDPRRGALYTRILGRPFDLARDVPIRCGVLRYGDRRHELLVCTHHIAGDGWTTSLLIRELAAAYRDRVAGAPGRPPDRLEYADFAVWQRQHVEPLVAPQIEFWRERLKGVAPLELPTDRPRPPVQSKRGARLERVLDAATVRRIRELALERRATAFSVVLAAFEAVLGRAAGSDDVVVGMPINGRRSAETEEMFGCFLNTLVLRTSLAGNPTFAELIDRVAATSLDAQSHQDVPFERLLEELKPPRDLSRTPWFQVFFNYMESLPSPELELAEVSMTPVEVGEPSASFDLTLYVRRAPGGSLELSALYCADLFDPSTIAEWLDAMIGILERSLDDPQLRVTELTEGTVAEPSVAAGLPELVTTRFERAAAAHPEAPAVLWEGEALTYGWLRERVLATGQLIVDAPKTSGRVGLLFRKGPEMVVGVFAALYAGRSYVALDASYPTDRLRYMLEHAECDAVVCASDTVELARELSGDRRPIAVVGEGRGALDGPCPVAPEAEAYVLYTSGSTGVPKGVVQTQLNLANFVDIYAKRAGIRPGDRLSLVSSFSFDAAISDIFGALVSGAAVCPFDVKEQGFAALPSFLSSSGVTVYHSTPTVFRALLDGVDASDVLRQLRVVVLGGEPVINSDLTRFREVFPPGARLVNNLGASECSISLWADFTTETRIRGRLPMGAPVERTRVLLLDDTGAESFVGQLVIQTDHFAVGYLKNDTQTEGVFREIEGRRSYVSGDYAYRRADGMYVSLGRRDRQVKVRGNRIELGEVEAAARAHPSTGRAAAMVVRPPGDPEATEGILCAFVEAPADSRDALRAHLQSRLPGYMVPSQIFVLDDLPMTPSGKVDYGALEGIRANFERGPIRPPTTELEKAVAAALVHAIPGVTEVGLDDHFFDDLGGTSLGLVRAAQHLSASLGAEVRTVLLFEYPTIVALCRAIEAPSELGGAGGPTTSERKGRRERAMRARRRGRNKS